MTNVTSDDTTITLSFSDGETIQVEEDDLEETAEMHYYLSGLIGLNITIEYTCYYSLLSSGYEINSVTPEQA